MFRAIILPIFRNTRLFVTACGINAPMMLPATGRQHRGGIIPQAVTHSIVLLKMGKIIARNMLGWLELLKIVIVTSSCLSLLFISMMHGQTSIKFIKDYLSKKLYIHLVLFLYILTLHIYIHNFLLASKVYVFHLGTGLTVRWIHLDFPREWLYSVTTSASCNIYQLLIFATEEYTECNRRNGPDFGRVFLMLNYTENPQNTYIQCSMVTEI